MTARLLRLVSSTSIGIGVLFALVASADVPPDCQCRDAGGAMRDLGSVICVDITGSRYRVRCEMSTNTPYWNRLDDSDGCPLA